MKPSPVNSPLASPAPTSTPSPTRIGAVSKVFLHKTGASTASAAPTTITAPTLGAKGANATPAPTAITAPTHGTGPLFPAVEVASHKDHGSAGLRGVTKSACSQRPSATQPRGVSAAGRGRPALAGGAGVGGGSDGGSGGEGAPHPSRGGGDGEESEDSLFFPVDADFLENSALAKNIFNQINEGQSTVMARGKLRHCLVNIVYCLGSKHPDCAQRQRRL